MSARPFADEALRSQALEALGPLGDATARRALEAGALEIERDVLAWEGSHGSVRGHRVVVRVPDEIASEVGARPAAVDALIRAVSAAVARSRGEALADLVVTAGAVATRRESPYRGRS